MKPSDEQQARLLESLRAAGGALSFEQLRAMGFENPALLCYELTAAGVPLTRFARGRAQAPGVRLEQRECAPSSPRSSWRERLRSTWRAARALVSRLHDRVDPKAFVNTKASSTARMSRAHPLAGKLDTNLAALIRRRGGARYRLPAKLGFAAALAAALAAAIALALSAHTGKPAAGLHADHPVSVQRARHTVRQRERRPAPASEPRRRSAPDVLAVKPADTAVSAAAAAALQNEGHQLLAGGRYAQAIRQLESALAASGQSLARCIEPTSDACLTFAYALYDLGRALRLDGHASAAVRILSERLRIDNQRAIVQQELNLARAGAAAANAPARAG